MSRHLYRLLIHAILAVFLANAANKFFVEDLEYEQLHGFYAKIFAFEGAAPDQFRILPLLGIKALMTVGDLPFNHAVLIFNFLCSFLIFELFWRMLPGFSDQKKYLFHFLYATAFIYLQYTGWRPDTQGLVLLCTALAYWGRFFGKKKGAWIVSVLLISLLAFARAEVALGFGLYLAWHVYPNWGIRALLLLIPVGVQVLLQKVLFPEAVYYTDTIMIMDNLRLHYFLRNPATYALIAVGLIWHQSIKKEVLRLAKNFPLFLILVVGYLALVFVVGRINEYRLYLPFVPLYLLTLDRGRKGDGEKIGGI